MTERQEKESNQENSLGSVLRGGFSSRPFSAVKLLLDRKYILNARGKSEAGRWTFSTCFQNKHSWQWMQSFYSINSQNNAHHAS